MAKNLSNGPSEGISFGQSTSDKISFYGVTTIVQPSSADQAAITAGATTTACNTAVIELRRSLVALGLIKGGA